MLRPNEGFRKGVKRKWSICLLLIIRHWTDRRLRTSFFIPGRNAIVGKYPGKGHLHSSGGAHSIGARFHIAGKEAPNILFFHGNGEIVSDYDDLGPVYNRIGINFLPVTTAGMAVREETHG